MVKVDVRGGRVVFEVVDGSLRIAQILHPALARQLSYDISAICNKIENWSWAPGGGDVEEVVIHPDDHWYNPNNEALLPDVATECLVTTEGPDGRHVNTALYLPADGKNPRRWVLPVTAMAANGQSSLERVVAWSPLPRPSRKS